MSDQDNRPVRPRTSLVDRGWDEIPNVIPDDTVVDPTVDSKELTSPDPSRRPADMARAMQREPGPSALGLPPASRTPVAAPTSGRASAPPSQARPSRPGRPSTPPPPPSGRASVPPSAPLRPSAPPPPPSRRASVPPARPSNPPPAPKRVSRPPPPEPLVETLSESLHSIASAPQEAAALPASSAAMPAAPAVAVPAPAPIAPSSLAPTQPSPMAYAARPADAAAGPSSAWPGPPSRAPGVDELPTLQEALTQRVRVGQGAGPLWGFALIAVALALGGMAVFSGSCSAMLARVGSPSAAPSAKRASSAPASAAPAPRDSALAEASTAPPPPAAPVEAGGSQGLDEDAKKVLEARPPGERSVDDVLALGAADAADKRRVLRDDAARASQNPLYAGSPELAAKLKSSALDPDTMRDALASMAKLSSPLGADLLYSIWTTRKKTDPAVALAEALLRTDVVRKQASPALLVALDLRAAGSCDAAKEALTRAAEHGDRRVIPLLGRFTQKKGCGDGKRDDCWPCLREGDELKNAAKAVGGRAPPKL